MKNTSQDPDYVGPTGHEKKFHKTHFGAPEKKLKSNTESEYEWAETSPGHWKRVKKERQNETQH